LPNEALIAFGLNSRPARRNVNQIAVRLRIGAKARAPANQRRLGSAVSRARRRTARRTCDESAAGTALIRRAKEGGSHHVRVNLARCAMWFMSLCKFDKDAPT